MAEGPRPQWRMTPALIIVLLVATLLSLYLTSRVIDVGQRGRSTMMRPPAR